MNEMIQKLNASIRTSLSGLDATVKLSKRELLLGTIACITSGMVLGMLMSPRKTTMFGCNNGSNNTTSVPEKDEPCKEEENK